VIYLRVTPVKNVVMDIMESKLVSGRMVELHVVGLWSRDSDVTRLEILVSYVARHWWLRNVAEKITMTSDHSKLSSKFQASLPAEETRLRLLQLPLLLLCSIPSMSFFFWLMLFSPISLASTSPVSISPRPWAQK